LPGLAQPGFEACIGDKWGMLSWLAVLITQHGMISLGGWQPTLKSKCGADGGAVRRPPIPIKPKTEFA